MKGKRELEQIQARREYKQRAEDRKNKNKMPWEKDPAGDATRSASLEDDENLDSEGQPVSYSL